VIRKVLSWSEVQCMLFSPVDARSNVGREHASLEVSFGRATKR
jgi:hypothetical protein